MSLKSCTQFSTMWFAALGKYNKEGATMEDPVTEVEKHLKEKIHADLNEKYSKSVLSKKEMAEELGVSLRTLNTYIKEGAAPKHKKLGTSKNAKIVFPVAAVADYLVNFEG